MGDRISGVMTPKRRAAARRGSRRALRTNSVNSSWAAFHRLTRDENFATAKRPAKGHLKRSGGTHAPSHRPGSEGGHRAEGRNRGPVTCCDSAFRPEDLVLNGHEGRNGVEDHPAQITNRDVVGVHSGTRRLIPRSVGREPRKMFRNSCPFPENERRCRQGGMAKWSSRIAGSRELHVFDPGETIEI